MDTRSAAAVWADQQIAAVRDDPSARVALVERTYHGQSIAVRIVASRNPGRAPSTEMTGSSASLRRR